ncbi:hypothetical protein M5D96_012864 [Drosophila gunungcola]|uniref:Uncharacterized protein n=1 Tax=Drosophila gunungcola TaxID=103775 RepID=A0A9Q0BJP9_9MUSC|nr:hypothetical protein M5D96_012864 [Drosophila gunungcola]
MSMALCNLNGDGSTAQSTSQSPATAAAPSLAHSHSHSHTLQQESTPLLLGHEQSGGSAATEGIGIGGGGDVTDRAVTSIEMPTVSAGSDPVPSLPLPQPLLMALPANLNFVTGPTTQQLMIGNGAVGVAPSINDNNNNNNNNNNVDNTSDESNPVTIYRCRAPIASLDCMEEFSGTGGHLDFGIKLLTII